MKRKAQNKNFIERMGDDIDLRFSKQKYFDEFKQKSQIQKLDSKLSQVLFDKLYGEAKKRSEKK